MSPNTDKLRMTCHNIEVSGTSYRSALYANDYIKWCESVPLELRTKFTEYRDILNLIEEITYE